MHLPGATSPITRGLTQGRDLSCTTSAGRTFCEQSSWRAPEGPDVGKTSRGSGLWLALGWSNPHFMSSEVSPKRWQTLLRGSAMQQELYVQNQPHPARDEPLGQETTCLLGVRKAVHAMQQHQVACECCAMASTHCAVYTINKLAGGRVRLMTHVRAWHGSSTFRDRWKDGDHERCYWSGQQKEKLSSWSINKRKG